MTYDPFSTIGGGGFPSFGSLSPYLGGNPSQTFGRGGILGQLPSFQTTTGTPYGFKTTSQYGTSGLDPASATAAQKAEIQRLQSIQGLQAGAFDLQQKQAEAEKQRQMDAARNYVASNITRSGILQGTAPTGIPQYMITQAKNEYLSSKMQTGAYGFGGFSSGLGGGMMGG